MDYKNGWTPLHLAAWKGHLSSLQTLLDATPSVSASQSRLDLNRCTADGNTALMCALKGTTQQHRAVFDRLLDAGADLHLRNHVTPSSLS
jgi:ankyrin repeat protein